MLSFEKMPSWNRRLWANVVAVAFLAVILWRYHSTQTIVVSILVILAENLFPFRAADEAQKNKN